MLWKYFGLNKEPNLSINPLLRKEELIYFVNRESELAVLKSYFDTEFPKHVLISGRAGTGKTSLVCHEGIPRENSDFIRMDLSHHTGRGQILDRITLDLIEFAYRLKMKEAEVLREDFLYHRKELREEILSAEGSIPLIAKAGGSTKKGVEKTRKRLSTETEQTLDKILVLIEKHLKYLPVIFLDESDHLPHDVQDNILSDIEPLLTSSRCKVIFSTRKEIEQIFLGDVNSRYRAKIGRAHV